MIGNLLGITVSLKMRLMDKAIERLPEPLRSEAAGLRAATAGRMKEIAGLGIEILSCLNEKIVVSPEATEGRLSKSDNGLKRIELD